jgi:hypothetical protein
MIYRISSEKVSQWEDGGEKSGGIYLSPCVPLSVYREGEEKERGAGAPLINSPF